MKIKVKFIIFIVILIPIIIFPFYYQNKTLVQSEGAKNITLILKNKKDDYWRNVQLGAEEAAKEYKVKLNIMAPEDECSTLEQENLINQVVENNTNALVLAPCSFDYLVKSVEDSVDKGIPVLTIDSKVNTDKISCFITTDNLSAGKSAGEKIVSLVGENSIVAIVGLDKKTGSNYLERYEGLKKYITENYQGIQMIEESDAINDSNSAELATEKLLINNRISGVVALNYEASVGAARAIEKLNFRGKVMVVAFDGDPQEIEYMENGTIQSVIIQNPFSMGYLGVKNAVLKLQGKDIPEFIESGFTVIDKRNIYLPENQKILFPFTQ
ncbi:substrate-binding domain-containing protein [Clostridium sp. SHJSY1]|uniref:substrate-binding domain-containing protein n=1 Tax=Clostridium sp. SHJSY1 TaxID=2942483 RepID=UPI0028754864|nr:substrate-binding domain-containing protein [Clostridium sp. SHJSY1]MDS0524239.1 substrate-binding domain-containing protein [Clostridium sp. SHJSY1]